MSDLGERLIERQFPLHKIDQLIARWSRERHPVDQMAGWFDALPEPLVRAALLAAIAPAGQDDHEERRALLTLIDIESEPREIMNPAKRSERAEAALFTALLGEEAAAQAGLLAPKRIEINAKRAAWAGVRIGVVAKDLADLIMKIGDRDWGRIPRVVDPFSGVGTIPLEAGRIGAIGDGVELHPLGDFLARLMLDLDSAPEPIREAARATLRRLLEAPAKLQAEIGVDSNQRGERFNLRLYATELRDPRSGWLTPLLPSLLIDPEEGVWLEPIPNHETHTVEIAIRVGSSVRDQQRALAMRTWDDGKFIPLVDSDGRLLDEVEKISFSRRAVRDGGTGSAAWGDSDVTPPGGGKFQERLLAVRWTGPGGTRWSAPTSDDLRADMLVRSAVMDALAEGHSLQSSPIRSDYHPLIRERGWQRWHHLYHPWQLLARIAIANQSMAGDDMTKRLGALVLGSLAEQDWRLSEWNVEAGQISERSAFYHPAPPLYAVRQAADLFDSGIFGTGDRILGMSNLAIGDSRAEHRQGEIVFSAPPSKGRESTSCRAALAMHWVSPLLEALATEEQGRLATDPREPLAIEGDWSSSAQLIRTSLADESGIAIVWVDSTSGAVFFEAVRHLWDQGLYLRTAWPIAKPAGALLVFRTSRPNGSGYLSELEAEVYQRAHQQGRMILHRKDRESLTPQGEEILALSAAVAVISLHDNIPGIDLPREFMRFSTRAGDIASREGSVIDVFFTAARSGLADGLAGKPLATASGGENAANLSRAWTLGSLAK